MSFDELPNFNDFPINDDTGRPFCDRCSRPASVCWCSYLPDPRLNINTNIIILQHPYEETRRIKTAPILKESLHTDKCHIIIGRRFPINKHPVLKKALSNSQNTYLMFPGPLAVDAATLASQEQKDKSIENTEYNIILLDGTWLQARTLFSQNPFLSELKQVQVNTDKKSEYVIRTQPTDASLSTLETAAHVISVLENAPQYYEVLLAPLRAMCSFQLDCGSVKHHSKQYLIENSLFCKALPKSRRRRRAMKKNFSVDI